LQEKILIFYFLKRYFWFIMGFNKDKHIFLMEDVMIFIILILLIIPSSCMAGETITAQELESYFYANGEMKRSGPQFEITYYIEGDKITRTRVYDIKKREVIPDNTVYYIIRQLWSDPTKDLSWEKKKVVRAIGKPGEDAVELLVIGDNFIQFVKSTSHYFVISRLKRLN
jgi:hypothetical protein